MEDALREGIKAQVEFIASEYVGKALTEEQISDIADAIIYNESVWEVVNTAIENEINGLEDEE